MPITLDVSGFVGMEPSPYRLRLPGWDDVIHWAPRSSGYQVDPDAARRRMFSDLAHSPTPEIAKDFAQIGQEIDNVQDALVALAVLGRVSVKLTGRLLPGVGWVATAADVLNLLNLFYPPNAIGVTRWFTGKGGKRKSYEYARRQGGTYRRRLEETLKTGKVGFTYGEALQILQTTDALFGVGVSLGPIFGAASDVFFGVARGMELEVPTPAEVLMGQRSAAALFRVDQYFGFGVSRLLPLGVASFIGMALGALGVTAPNFENADFAYERLRVSWPGVIPLYDRALGNEPGSTEAIIAQELRPAIGPTNAAIAGVLYSFGYAWHGVGQAAVQFGRAAAWLGGYRDALPWQVHVDLAMGQALLVGLLKPAMQASAWGELAAPVAARPWWGGPLPLVPAATSMSVGEVCAAVRDGGGTAPQTWLEEVPAGLEREFCQSLVNTTVDELVSAMEGPDVRVHEDSGPLWRAWAGMHEVDLMVPEKRTDAEALAYIEAAAALTPEAGEGFAPRAALEAVYRQIWPGVDASW